MVDSLLKLRDQMTMKEEALNILLAWDTKQVEAVAKGLETLESEGPEALGSDEKDFS
jgi:hypothetical protein